MYSQIMQVQSNHIDFQNILDSLYYPHYMEKVRHDYMKEVFNIDIIEAAKKGHLYVLRSYNINFKRSLYVHDKIKVTADAKFLSNIKLGCYQQIISTKDNLLCADANFEIVCVNQNTGRPFLPNELKNILETLKNNN